MNMKWMKPNEGRLHKGNPFKSVTNTVSKVGGAVSKAVGSATNADWWTKSASSLASAAADPGTWLSYAVNPTFGLGMGVQKAADTYSAMTDAERAKAEAEAKAARAAIEEQRLLNEQKATEAKQSKMIREREAKAQASAAERIKRLGTGRRGLLYQGASGSAQGVSDVLGG